MRMAGALSSIVLNLLLMGLDLLATGCQSLLSTHLNLNFPIVWIEVALLVVVILIIIQSRILMLASIGLVALYLTGY